MMPKDILKFATKVDNVEEAVIRELKKTESNQRAVDRSYNDPRLHAQMLLGSRTYASQLQQQEHLLRQYNAAQQPQSQPLLWGGNSSNPF
jgi:hypothetical protein